jgi:hypothetical protein
MAKRMKKEEDIRANKNATDKLSEEDMRSSKQEMVEQRQLQREAQNETRQLQREAEDEEIQQEREMEDEGIVVVDFVRVQARVSRKNFEYLKREANRTGTNISAIASIYIADGVEAHLKKDRAEKKEGK